MEEKNIVEIIYDNGDFNMSDSDKNKILTFGSKVFSEAINKAKEKNQINDEEIRIDWSVIREALENHWFETDPRVSDSELDETAIGVAGEVDQYIKKMAVDKLHKLERQLEIIRDDISGYGKFVQRNINQSNEIIALKKEHFSIIERIFDELYKQMKRDFELVQIGDWDKSWIRSNILKLKEKYLNKKQR